LTPLCKYDTAVQRGPNVLSALATFKDKIVFGHTSVIDTCLHKIGDFIVEYLREFEAIFKKALYRGAQGELFDEKKTEV
jgi:hypothetical protein